MLPLGLQGLVHPRGAGPNCGAGHGVGAERDSWPVLLSLGSLAK